MSSAAGYSGKPLFQKLGLKAGMVCKPVGAPDHYPDLIAGAEDVRFSPRAKTADMVHLFCPNEATLSRGAEKALAAVRDGGMLWISWPKKSSTLFRDLTEDGVRAAILPFSWVDVKVCAVDGDWSGLKFLRRKSR